MTTEGSRILIHAPIKQDSMAAASMKFALPHDVVLSVQIPCAATGKCFDRRGVLEQDTLKWAGLSSDHFFVYLLSSLLVRCQQEL